MHQDFLFDMFVFHWQLDVDIATHIQVTDDGPKRRFDYICVYIFCELLSGDKDMVVCCMICLTFLAFFVLTFQC